MKTALTSSEALQPDTIDAPPNRQVFAEMIAHALRSNRDRLAAEFIAGPKGIRSCVLDDVLDEPLMQTIEAGLPKPEIMLRREGFRERKYVTAELSDLDLAVRELILGLASAPVAAAVSEVTGLAGLEHDRELYNGGLTLMTPGDFMMPHLDNSHDRSRSRRRAMVLLFYLAEWREPYGGALKLWSRDQRSVLRTVGYRRNRIVLLEASNDSWHSVEAITGPDPRVNVTTYFYDAATGAEPVRLTRYAGWTGDPVSRAMAQADFAIRTMAFKMGLDRFVKKRHVLSRPVA